MTILYRATVEQLVLNEPLPSPSYDLSTFEESHQRAEVLLEKRCPGNRSRLSIWFACDTPDGGYIIAPGAFGIGIGAGGT